MSWQIFADEVGAKMRAANWKTSDEFALFFTKKKDECIKEGCDVTTKKAMKKGNTELMYSMLQLTGMQGLVAGTSFYSTYMTSLGNAIKGYWTGAILQTYSIPLIPAVGTLANIQVTSNIVTKPGEFIGVPTLPITDVASFLNTFISLAQSHLLTIEGTCYTISQYPPPLPPGPAIINWIGYKIDMGKLSSEKLISDIKDKFKLDDAHKDAIKKDIEDTNSYIEEKEVDDTIPYEEKEESLSSAEEYKSLLEDKLENEEETSVDVYDDVNEITESIPVTDDLVEKIKAYAKMDIGVMEQSPTTNYGGKVTTYLKGVGINGPAYWCAAFVSHIWKQAGAFSPNSASCQQWYNWAKKNGLWSSKPQPGAAVLYANKSGRCHHIGICIATDGKDRITTIEGNTSGGGFNRDGVGVFKKNPRVASIYGYVLPKKK